MKIQITPQNGQSVLIHRPEVLSLKYQKESGEIKEYEIVPIGFLSNRMNAYAFGHGVRSFVFSRIMRIR